MVGEWDCTVIFFFNLFLVRSGPFLFILAEVHRERTSISIALARQDDGHIAQGRFRGFIDGLLGREEAGRSGWNGK